MQPSRARRRIKRLVLVGAAVVAAVAMYFLGTSAALADIVWTVPQP